MTYMNGKYVTYTYNSRYWLTGEFYYNSDDSPIDNMTYVYSATGNRLQQFQNGGTLVQEMTYNAFNQLVEEKDCASGVTYTYFYDANGNLTSKTGDDGSTETYTYNYENRQIGWTDGTTEQRTAFNGTTSNRISFDDNGNVLIMVYLGNDVIQDRDGTFSLKKEYITPSLDENLMMIIPAGEDNAGSYYYFQDGLGSVVELRDSSENTVNSYKYRAFGASNGTATQGINNRYQYTGRENNGHGQQYSRARTYFNKLGRFGGADEILQNNLYSYVENLPISNSDPFGLWVVRNSNLINQAGATSNKPSDTWDSLGEMWGLDPEHYEDWVSTTMVGQSGQLKAKPDLCQEYFIPNTYMMLLGNQELPIVGGLDIWGPLTFTKYEKQNAELQGFHVWEFYNKDTNTPNNILNKFQAFTRLKWLWGFWFIGHGGEHWLNLSTPNPGTDKNYMIASDISDRLKYGLAYSIINACRTGYLPGQLTIGEAFIKGNPNGKYIPAVNIGEWYIDPEMSTAIGVGALPFPCTPLPLIGGIIGYAVSDNRKGIPDPAVKYKTKKRWGGGTGWEYYD